jgi:hypothetical protein
MDGQKPIVGLGMFLGHGRVVRITLTGVVLDVQGKGLRTYSFAQIEKMIWG